MRQPRFTLFFLLFMVMFLSSPGLSALSLDEICESDQYYWGMGESTSLAEAEKNALAALASRISVNVKEHTYMANRSSKVHTGGKAQVDERSDYESMVTTYADATLHNCETLQLRDGDLYRVVRYIARDNVFKVFEDRRQRISDLLDSSFSALNLNKVDVALKDLYWAYALLLSMPTTSSEEWHGKKLHQYIPARIDEVLDDIKVTVSRRDDNDYQLFFTYQGRPVHSLDYVYYENGVPGPLSCAGEGYGEISLLSPEPPRNIEIEIEYKYIDQAVDSQMRMILNNPVQYESKNRIKNVAIASATPEEIVPAPAPPAAPEKPDFDQISGSIPAPPEPGSEAEKYARYAAAARQLLADIAAKKPVRQMRGLLVDSILLKYQSIIGAGNVKVINADSLEFSRSARGDVLCRGAVILFRYRTGRYRTFSRDIAITFNRDGKVTDINMGLGKAPRRDIEETTLIPLYVRQAIIEFIENYQTAFALRDLDYIARIFDDNAIIITVTQLPRPKGRVEDYEFNQDPKLIHNRYTKDSYLAKMDTAFKSREYINLRFNKIDIDIVDEDRQIYAISLEQDYFSPHYADHGYLFLLARFDDPINPVIHVRTWQPEFVRPRDIYNKFDFPITR